jgi:hypothetical protein
MHQPPRERKQPPEQLRHLTEVDERSEGEHEGDDGGYPNTGKGAKVLPSWCVRSDTHKGWLLGCKAAGHIAYRM